MMTEQEMIQEHRAVVAWYRDNPAGVNEVGAWLSPNNPFDYTILEEDEDEE